MGTTVCCAHQNGTFGEHIAGVIRSEKIFRKEVLDKNESNRRPKAPVPYVSLFLTKINKRYVYDYRVKNSSALQVILIKFDSKISCFSRVVLLVGKREKSASTN
jgi:hypothetical protein